MLVRPPASSIHCWCGRICARVRHCPRMPPGRRHQHSGAALHLFAAGVAQRVVKADVASLYPSLMRAFRIGPSRDHLGRCWCSSIGSPNGVLQAKAAARAAPAGLGRASHARGDVGGHEAGGELRVRLSRCRRRTDTVRGRACRQRGDASRARDAGVHVPRAGGARRHLARGRYRRRVLCGAGVTGPKPTSARVVPRSPHSCRRSCSWSSRDGTRPCCRTSPRTTRCDL
jgi:DNA polymerase elongation subunit (family B)